MDDIAHRDMVRTPHIRTAPRRRVLHCALAAFGLGLLPALSVAQPYYPRIVDSGEDRTIDYGPGPHDNIVGGGHVIMSGGGWDAMLSSVNPHAGQPPRAGMMPFTTGSGESPTTVWVPVDIDPLRQALIGGDGSLPETAPSSTSVRNASRTAGPRS
jgi:hypothetical protein